MYSHQLYASYNSIIHGMYVCMLLECGDPGILLQGSVSLFITENGSTIVTYSCDPGYSQNGSITSLCVLGEWTLSPQTVTCILYVYRCWWKLSQC